MDIQKRCLLLEHIKKNCFCPNTLKFFGNWVLDTTPLIKISFNRKVCEKTKLPPTYYFPLLLPNGMEKKTKNKTDRDLFLSTPLLLLACRQLTPWLRQRCSSSSPAGCRQPVAEDAKKIRCGEGMWRAGGGPSWRTWRLPRPATVARGCGAPRYGERHTSPH